MLIVVVLLAAAAIAACGSTAAGPTQPEPVAGPDGAALLQERCSVCHDVNRVTQARNTRDAWDRTVTDMVGKGAQLTDEEKSILVEYLAATYGG